MKSTQGGAGSLRENNSGDHQVWHGLVPAVRDCIERKPEGSSLPATQWCGRGTHNRHALAIDLVAIRAPKDASELDGNQPARTLMGDLSNDLHYLLLHEVLRRFHLHVTQAEILDIRLGLRLGLDVTRLHRYWAVQEEQLGNEHNLRNAADDHR